MTRAQGGLHLRGLTGRPPGPEREGASMDEPDAVDYVTRIQMVCMGLELLRFVAWMIMLVKR